jgi:methionyl-tRNA formyltransferase
MSNLPDKVLFCGTPEFAVPILERCHTVLGSRLIGVLTRPEAPFGRGQQLRPSPVHAAGQSLDLAVHTPTTKKELKAIVEALQPDLIIVVAYGMIFPKSVVDGFFCLNIHGSLLPQYRGASPIHASLLNRDHETGITLIKMNASMDTGDIISTRSTAILPDDNFASLHDRLSQIGAEITTEFLIAYPNISLTPQDDRRSSYCHKLTTADMELKTKMPIDMIMGRIKAFSPAPGAFIMAGNRRVKIIDATVKDDCIIPLRVKPEGKGEMAYADYLRGNGPLI